MRNPNRISPFMEDLGTIWRNCCPDWRFGQLICNVFDSTKYVPFMVSENTMMDIFINYFEIDKRPDIKQQLHYYEKIGGGYDGNNRERKIPRKK